MGLLNLFDLTISLNVNTDALKEFVTGEDTKPEKDSTGSSRRGGSSDKSDKDESPKTKLEKPGRLTTKAIKAAIVTQEKKYGAGALDEVFVAIDIDDDDQIDELSADDKHKFFDLLMALDE